MPKRRRGTNAKERRFAKQNNGKKVNKKPGKVFDWGDSRCPSWRNGSDSFDMPSKIKEYSWK